MKEIFDQIYETRALSVIHAIAEEAIEDGATGRDLQYLNAILEENDLDTIWVTALLGAQRFDEAEQLQCMVDSFRARKADRKVS